MTGLNLKAPEGVKVAVLSDGAEAVAAGGTRRSTNPYFGKSMQTCGSFR